MKSNGDKPSASGYWAHCSPSLLAAGVDCQAAPRRICLCGSNGSHDHWVAHDVNSNQSLYLGELVFQGQQYLLLGGGECDILIGYWQDGAWYANCDGEDYALRSDPKRIIGLSDQLLASIMCPETESREERYHLVKLDCGRYQVGFQEKPGPFSSGQWYLDVFGTATFSPSQVIAPVATSYAGLLG